MRIRKARVQHYRSIRDSGFFEIEHDKTILVGPNEAGKTVLLQALQQINPPKGIPKFDPLRDYPRSEFNDITTGRVDPAEVTIVEAHFTLEEGDRAAIGEEFRESTYVCGRQLDNSCWHRLDDAPAIPTYADVRNDIARLRAHIEPRIPSPDGDPKQTENPIAELDSITEAWHDRTLVDGNRAIALRTWLSKAFPFIDEDNATEENRYGRLLEK